MNYESLFTLTIIVQFDIIMRNFLLVRNAYIQTGNDDACLNGTLPVVSYSDPLMRTPIKFVDFDP